jgi:hypothetical protein
VEEKIMAKIGGWKSRQKHQALYEKQTRGTCLALERSWIQPPVSPKKKKKDSEVVLWDFAKCPENMPS